MPGTDSGSVFGIFIFVKGCVIFDKKLRTPAGPGMNQNKKHIYPLSVFWIIIGFGGKSRMEREDRTIENASIETENIFE